MPEPASTTAATLAAATAAIPMITLLGIPLGLRADLLVAGFGGAISAIAFLNSVPVANDTWQSLFRVTVRRMGVVIAGSLTAGYLSPLVLSLVNLQNASLLGIAYATGAGAQQVLVFVIKRISGSNGGAS